MGSAGARWRRRTPAGVRGAGVRRPGRALLHAPQGRADGPQAALTVGAETGGTGTGRRRAVRRRRTGRPGSPCSWRSAPICDRRRQGRGRPLRRVARAAVRGRALRGRQPQRGLPARRPAPQPRPADRRHPFGYGKERFFWSLLAAVGIFVMGGCFSFFQGVEALRAAPRSLRRLCGGPRRAGRGAPRRGRLTGAGAATRCAAAGQGTATGSRVRDPALRTVVAEDGTAVLGVTLAIVGMAPAHGHRAGRVGGVRLPRDRGAARLRRLLAGPGRTRPAHRRGRRPGAEPRGSAPCWRSSPRSTAWRRCSRWTGHWTPRWWPPGSTSSPGSTASRSRRSPYASSARRPGGPRGRPDLPRRDRPRPPKEAGAESPAATGERGGA